MLWIWFFIAITSLPLFQFVAFGTISSFTNQPSLVSSCFKRRYFADRFKTYDTFFSFAFRKGKEQLKRVKQDGIYYINENHIIKYLRKREIKEIRKNKYLELLDEISMVGKLNKAGILLGYKHSNQIYDLRTYGRIGQKNMKLIRRNYKKLQYAGHRSCRRYYK